MDSMKHRRLQEMDRSDFEIVKGEPDIRGWDVKNSTGLKIGEVEELIVDAQQKKVRYMVVDLDDNELKLDHRKVLIPIGLAQLDKKDYDKNNVSPEVERRICTTLGRTQELSATTNVEEHHPDFYKHDYYNDDNLYKHRLHEAQPVQKDSEYDRGLRLWEKTSEGGILSDNSRNRDNYRESEIEENARMEMVRNRRSAYEQRRGGGFGRDNYRRNDNS